MELAWVSGSWRNPRYIETVVGILAVIALFGYSAAAPSAPSVGTILFVLLWVFIPTFLADLLAIWLL